MLTGVLDVKCSAVRVLTTFSRTFDTKGKFESGPNSKLYHANVPHKVLTCIKNKTLLHNI